MHHSSNGRRNNIHQAAIIHHPQTIMNMGPNMIPTMPPGINGRTQVISAFMSPQQQREMNRLGQHLQQPHRINAQMHQPPQIIHTKGRVLTNINNNHVHSYGGIPPATIKHHGHNMQPILNRGHHKLVSRNNHHAKIISSNLQTHDNNKVPEIARNGDVFHSQHEQPNLAKHYHGQTPTNKQRNHAGSHHKSQPHPLPQSHPLSHPQLHPQIHPKPQAQPQPQITILRNTNSTVQSPVKYVAPPIVVSKAPPTIKYSPAALVAVNPPTIIYTEPPVATAPNVCITPPAKTVAAEVPQKSQINESQKIENQVVKENTPEYKCGEILQSVCSTEQYSTKEKTPMCLVNELARYNKITHQYRLTSEEGPAHSKQFTVTLKLGNDEEYSADGPSIKKAQHSAAAKAVAKTKYEHPPIKVVRQKSGSNKGGVTTITPTVELNALAMKIGEPTIYVFEPSTSLSDSNEQVKSGEQSSNQPVTQNINQTTRNTTAYPENCQYNGQSMNKNSIFINANVNPNICNRYPYNRGRGPYSQRGGAFMKFNQNSRLPAAINGIYPNSEKDLCKITLLVGKQKFVGTGATIQAAKHDAAARALEILKPIAEDMNASENKNISADDLDGDIKSPISLVHEMALKRNFHVAFEVKGETGPPHMKTFLTVCIVGSTVTEGAGNAKKISKKRAAIKMVDELKKLPPIVVDKISSPRTATDSIQNANTKTTKRKSSKRTDPNIPQEQQRPVNVRKKTKNIIKEKPGSENLEDANPISKLIQIQQSLKEREPIYTVIEEKGAARHREFIMEVLAGGKTARGLGSNKKIAKKSAAKNLLILMGYATQSNPNKENNLKVENNNEGNLKNDVPENTTPGLAENQDVATNNNNKTTINNKSGNSNKGVNVPGVIHLPSKKNNSSDVDQTVNKNPAKKQQKQGPILSKNIQNVPKNYDNPVVPDEASSPKLEEKKSPTESSIRPKDQLLYLAQLIGFQAEFSDYPKGNHGEYLTIVTLSTVPPQICHGAGSDTEASQDKAAVTALQMLSKLGLDNVSPKDNNNAPTNDEKVFAAADSSKN